ncbi:SpoIIE family protein phosphatase [bacterium]|nr:SpoIIE family protein phosphatase [bacterium]
MKNQMSNHSLPSQQLDKRLLELTALFEISRSLSASINLNSILENILRIPMGHMLISRGMVLLKKGLEDVYSIEGIKGFPRQFMGKTIEVDVPPVRAVSVEDVSDKHLWKTFFTEFEIELILPLVSSRGVIGLVGFGAKIKGDAYEESELEFLDSLSNIAATTVANGLMVDEIQTVNRQLDRKIQQLNTIFDISREFNITLDLKKIGSLLSFAVMGELMVNKCIVMTRDDKLMQVLVCKGVDSPEQQASDLCQLSEPVFISDTDRFQNLQDMGISLLVPMRLQDETKGILAVGAKISEKDFLDSELEFLTTLGNQAMAALENARLFEEMLEKQRMEEELNLARSIQQNLLPSQLPSFKEVDIAAVNIPSREVGGDYYDVIPISETRFGVTIADVAGKGAGAAMLMANLQASLHALVSTDLPINDVLYRINRFIYQNTGLDKFITFFYGELDIKTGVFTYSNAGHNPPMKLNKNKQLEELSVGGIVLGMMEDVSFDTETIQLEQGDCILLYTDGITETMNAEEEEFGESRVLSCLKDRTDCKASQIIQELIDETRQFSGSDIQADDMTMVVIIMQ